MPQLSHHLALAALLLAGLLTGVPALMPGLVPSLIPHLFTADTVLPLVQHRQFMQALLGLGVVLAVFVPALRLAAIAGALLSNGAFVALALAAPAASAATAAAGLAAWVWLAGAALVPLLYAALVLAREAWQQARWEGVLPSPQPCRWRGPKEA